MTDTKHAGGRPPKDPEDRNVQRTIGMPPALWQKVDEHGGQPWLRKVVKATKMPALPPKPPRR